MLALAKLAVQPNMHPLSSLITSDARTKITNNAYPVFAGMTWAMVMYIFRWHPETLASSLRSSMVYMYVLLPLHMISPPFLLFGSSDLLSRC
jgi:peroxisomal membrane protein 4